MANSDSSLPDIITAAAPRKQIKLTGPSVPLEPGRHAVRRDLAELAVADRVFAQHFVVPLPGRVHAGATVRVAPRPDAAAVATLAGGDLFHILDIGRDWAWGRGDARGSVGYLPADALDL